MTVSSPPVALRSSSFEVIPDADGGAPVALLTVLRGPRTCERWIRDASGWVREVWGRSAATDGRWMFRRSGRSGLAAALRSAADDDVRTDLAAFERRIVAEHELDRARRFTRHVALDVQITRYGLPVPLKGAAHE